MEKSELKTLGTMLQEIVEASNNYYSLHEFLLEATEEERREAESKLSVADYTQFYDFMDGFTFVNENEIHMAVCEYFEAVNNRPVSMGEMGDLYDVAEDYMRSRNLEFEED